MRASAGITPNWQAGAILGLNAVQQLNLCKLEKGLAHIDPNVEA